MLATVSAVIYVPRSGRATIKAKTSKNWHAVFYGLLVLLVWAEQPVFADQANVFVYHRFNDSRYPSTNISRQDFKAHLKILQEHDFTVLALGDVVDRLLNETELPARCAVITVDDAFRSFLTDGWPLLKEYRYPATLFVSTDTVGDGDYLTWPELRTLADEGVEIGNHSAAHAYLLDNLNDLSWTEKVRQDLVRSQRAFQANLGYSPSLFAYPYGEYSAKLVQLVKEAGFIAAVAQQSGVITRGQDMFVLPRFPMGAGYATEEGFRKKLFMKHLPVEVSAPQGPVLKNENPPTLRFYLRHGGAVPATLSCYVPGQSDCRIDKVANVADFYEVKAKLPLNGRRSKYTVTASDASGKSWFWFSHLWVMPRWAKVADHSVP